MKKERQINMAKNTFKTKLHSISIYPLIFIFAYSLKGKKEEYEGFLSKKIESFSKLNILNIAYKKFDFFDKIKFFFDKESKFHEKTNILFDVNLENKPEKKELGIYDFLKKIDMFYSSSMLSRRISNVNLLFTLNFNEKQLTEDNLNYFLRYCLLSYASRKIDHLFLDVSSNTKYSEVYETMKKYIDKSSIVNFSNSKDLYVITCKQKDKKFDIIWSSTNREIELSDFNKVYDKFGNLLEENIKISKSPIYAYHK